MAFKKIISAIVVIFALISINLPSYAKYSSASVENVRISDYVNYTHIALELSGSPGTVDFQTIKADGYQILSVKLNGIQPGVLAGEYPTDSAVILGKIKVDSNSSGLTLTIPCHQSVDLAHLAWNPWDDMVTVDLPLLVPNHTRIPVAEDLQRFCDRDGGDGRVVILDAGHGGFDSGATPRYAESPRLIEKDMTLDLARCVKSLLQQHPKIKVFLTRYGDYLPVPFGLKGRTRTEYKNESLRYRVQLAKEYLGNVYISLHLNAPPSQSRSAHQRSRGYEIYYLGDSHAQDLINNPDVVELTNLGVEEQSITENHKRAILGVLKDNTPQNSMDLAGLITSEMKRIPWLEMRDPAMKSNRFTVIKQLLMPSVLVECLFITNPIEHEQIRSPKYRLQIANAIYNAVCRFLFEPSTPIPYAASAPVIAAEAQPKPKVESKVEPKIANPAALFAAIEAEQKSAPQPQTAPPPQVQETTEPQVHTVQQNETLASIADEYGVSVNQLRSLNKGKVGRKDVIQLGDTLRISGEAEEVKSKSSSAAAPLIRSVEMYTVNNGDTLDKIARRLDAPVDTLKSLNNFTSSNPKIYPGDKIKVPAKRRVAVADTTPYHKVRSGDTLDKIARRYGTSVTQLKRLNHFGLKNPRLFPGDSVRIR